MTTILLLSKKLSAQSLSISVRALEYLIARGELPTRRCGRRVLIPLSALEQFAKRDHPDSLVPARAPSGDASSEERQ
jgi:excisionase family DNA binding protein